ncbi:hypothetical protein [Dactylosporangium sp. CS-033363]|uniref:hypothetical protein n=1 Tax=Dactylosporangium sp. CS-033363 TaxID=3239935 RepID=UPI003D94EE8F
MAEPHWPTTPDVVDERGVTVTAAARARIRVQLDQLDAERTPAQVRQAGDAFLERLRAA